MTAQSTEKLIYKGKNYSMCTQPLDDYFNICNIKFEPKIICSALWRGYIGSWEIINDRLYLTGIQGNTHNYGKLKLTTFFPNFSERVFAHWYSGVIRLPVGKMLEYEHVGYGSTYEKDILIEVSKGVVINEEAQVNGISDDDEASEGYGVAAMTILSNEKGK